MFHLSNLLVLLAACHSNANALIARNDIAVKGGGGTGGHWCGWILCDDVTRPPRPPAPPTSSLFDYTPISDYACARLRTEEHHCFTSTLMGCYNGRYTLTCQQQAASYNVAASLAKHKNELPRSPVFLSLYGKRTLSADMFAPNANNILELQLETHPDFNTSALTDLGLINLYQLHFWKCINVTVNQHSLQSFTKLTTITFVDSVIKTLEVGAFEDVPSLQLLVLDGWFKTYNFGLYRDQVYRIHCTSEYAWFRDYLQRNPGLIQAKEERAVFNLAGLFNSRYDLRTIFHPVDCARADLTQQGQIQDLTEFSINIPV